jgi:hypothetical protein
MITQLISGLANEELLSLSDDIAAAITESSIIDDSLLPLLFLSLLALCNHERVVRIMRSSACVTSCGAEARQSRSRQGPAASTRIKTSRLSAP